MRLLTEMDPLAVDLLVFAIVAAVAAFCAWRLVELADRQGVAEMSDAAVSVYGIWDDNGAPLNKYAREHDRRQARKGERI